MQLEKYNRILWKSFQSDDYFKEDNQNYRYMEVISQLSQNDVTKMLEIFGILCDEDKGEIVIDDLLEAIEKLDFDKNDPSFKHFIYELKKSKKEKMINFQQLLTLINGQINGSFYEEELSLIHKLLPQFSLEDRNSDTYKFVTDALSEVSPKLDLKKLLAPSLFNRICECDFDEFKKILLEVTTIRIYEDDE